MMILGCQKHQQTAEEKIALLNQIAKSSSMAEKEACQEWYFVGYTLAGKKMEGYSWDEVDKYADKEYAKDAKYSKIDDNEKAYVRLNISALGRSSEGNISQQNMGSLAVDMCMDYNRQKK